RAERQRRWWLLGSSVFIPGVGVISASARGGAGGALFLWILTALPGAGGPFDKNSSMVRPEPGQLRRDDIMSRRAHSFERGAARQIIDNRDPCTPAPPAGIRSSHVDHQGGAAAPLYLHRPRAAAADPRRARHSGHAAQAGHADGHLS